VQDIVHLTENVVDQGVLEGREEEDLASVPRDQEEEFPKLQKEEDACKDVLNVIHLRDDVVDRDAQR